VHCSMPGGGIGHDCSGISGACSEEHGSAEDGQDGAGGAAVETVGEGGACIGEGVRYEGGCDGNGCAEEEEAEGGRDHSGMASVMYGVEERAQEERGR
jgi:hypothetical protein